MAKFRSGVADFIFSYLQKEIIKDFFSSSATESSKIDYQ